MMAADELWCELVSLLEQFRRQIASAPDGELRPSPNTIPLAAKAHQEATALLVTLRSEEGRDLFS